MPTLQSLLLSNPKVAARFMTAMPASYWVGAGEKHALELFHTAATKVPAYRDFLASNHVDHTRVRSIQEFSELVPVSDKSYFAENTLDRMVVGDITDAHIFYMSGGTTGDSIIGAGSRATLRAYPPALAAMLDLQWGICHADTKVLVLNAMSLGAWIGGTYASAIFTAASDQHPNIAFAAPGADVERTLDLVESLGPHFDMILLISYPTLVKEILHAGLRRGIDWRTRCIKLVVSGERLDLALRHEILGMISSPIDHHAIMNQYGASEMGNPGVETPLASTIIRLATENAALCRDIFNSDTPLTLMQSNPVGAFMEIVDGRIVGTVGDYMPVIRYSPKDLGRVFSFDEMNAILQGHGIDITCSLAEDGWDKPVFRWPFLMVGTRADYAVSIYGAKVSPNSVQDIFAEDQRVRRFMLTTDLDGDYVTLSVHVELRAGLSPSADEIQDMRDRYARATLERLLELNFDYRDAFAIHAEAMVPRVFVHACEKGPFEAQQDAFKPQTLG